MVLTGYNSHGVHISAGIRITLAEFAAGLQSRTSISITWHNICV